MATGCHVRKPGTASALERGSAVGVVLTIGDKVYCRSFGGTMRFHAGRQYRAKDAPAPAACPPTTHGVQTCRLSGVGRPLSADPRKSQALPRTTPATASRRPCRSALLDRKGD